MIAASAAWSTSVTKSFDRLGATCSRSTSSAARLMMAPAARAALTAMLSMGCSACDMGMGSVEGGHAPGRPGACAAAEWTVAILAASDMTRRSDPLHPHQHQPRRQRRRGGARDEGHGLRRPGAGGAALGRRAAARGNDRAWPAARSTCSTGARVVATLAEALDGVTYLCATAMTPRDFGPPTIAPREHFADARGRRAPRRLPVRLRALRHAQRRRLPLPCLPEDPDRSGLRLAQPGPGGPADRLRVAPGAGRLRGRGARRRCGALADAVAVRGAGRALGAGAGGDRLPRPGRAEEADAAAEPARQPGRAHRGGNPHPARRRPGNARSDRR